MILMGIHIPRTIRLIGISRRPAIALMKDACIPLGAPFWGFELIITISFNPITTPGTFVKVVHAGYFIVDIIKVERCGSWYPLA